MLSPLWRFEWREWRLERSLRILVPLFACLVAYAAYNGATWSLLQRRTIRSLQQEEMRRLDSLKTVFARISAGDTTGVAAFNDPRVPSIAGSRHTGRWIFLPPGPLEALSVGQSDLYPYFIRLTTLTRQAAVINEEIENPLTLLTGHLDVEFVMLVAYPLLILALTYNIISGEREQGTLALIAAQPLSVRSVLVRKLSVKIVGLVLFTALLSVIAAVATGVTPVTADDFVRLAMWIGIAQVYGLFWFSVALAVNVRARTSATSAIAVLAVWFVVVVAIPALSSALVVTLYRVPSRISLTNALRAQEIAQAASSPNSAAALSDFLAGHPVLKNGSASDTLDPQIVAVLAADQLEKGIQPVFDNFDARLRARQDAADAIRIFSPALAAHAALLDVAGTGVTRYRRFDSQYVVAHNSWREHFNRMIFAGAPFTSADIDSLPKFEWREQPVGTEISRLALSVAAIALPAAVLAVYSLRSMRRLHIPLG